MSAKAGTPLLPGVQYLRGYAVLLVAFIHANGMMRYPQYFGTSPASLSLIGLFGVAVFFVISGFIITIVCFDRDERQTVSARGFFKRRFVRIVPFMWLATVGYNALSLFGTGKLEWEPLARALVLWPTGELKPNVLWSLRHEWLFYALFAATMLLPRRALWLLVAWFLAPLVTGPLLHLLDPEATRLSPTAHELIRLVLEGSQSGANLQFGAGALLGWLWLKGGDVFRARLPGGPALLLVVSVAGAFLVERVLGPAGVMSPLVWTLLAAGTVALGLVVLPTRGVAHRAALMLGNASYAIYLVHNPVLLIALELAARLHVGVDPWVFWWAASLVAVAGGIAAHYAVEKPLVNALTRRTRSAKAPIAIMR